MRSIDKARELRATIQTVEDAKKAIKSLYGWEYWFIYAYEYAEDRVPRMCDVSDEKIIDVAREQLLYDNSELLQELHDAEFEYEPECQ